MKKIKIGFIGYGKSTHRYHLPYIDFTNKYEVVGYYSVGSNSFEMEYPGEILDGVIRFEELDELLNSDVELVIITTPAEYHFEYAKAVIKSNKHVLVEKPFCHKVSEAIELFELGRVHNVKVMPYQNRRFDSDFITFKNVLNDARLGKVMEIESNHTHYRTDGVDHCGSIYDGSVYGHAVHFVDQIISVFGKPDEVIADIANQKQYYIGNGSKMNENYPEDYYDIKLIYDNLRVRVRFSQLVVKQPPRWIINGTLGTYEKYFIDQQERDLKSGIYPSSSEFGKDVNSGKIYTLDNEDNVPTIYGGYNLFYEEVYECIINNKVFIVSEEELLTNIGILESIVTK